MLATDVEQPESSDLLGRARAGDEAGRSIRLDGLSAGVQAPHMVMEDGQRTTRYLQTGIHTDIDLRENQKAVIGKTSLEGGAETVFIVVTGKVID